MKSLRFKYLLLVIVIVCLGILSRKVEFIPLFIGDFLYATLIYFGLRLLFTNQKKEVIAIAGLLLCFFIELSQLIQGLKWLNDIRKTQLGHYALGEGFLWSDIIAYTFGISISYIIDRK